MRVSRKAVAVVLCLSLLDFGPVGYGSALNPYALVEGEYSSHQGNPKPYIIHIRDLHCNEEAQMNISKILKAVTGSAFRVSSKDVPGFPLPVTGNNELIYDGQRVTRNDLLVLVEGAEGEVDTSLFSSFPDAEIRKTASKEFVKEGKMTGPEYLSISEPELGLRIMGVEDGDLYIQNFKAFRDVIGERQVTGEFLKEVGDRVEQLKEKVYSKELLELDEKVRGYREGKIDLQEYAMYLKEAGQGLSFSDTRRTAPRDDKEERYPNFSMLIEVLERQKNIDLDQVEKERNALMEELSQKLPKEELGRIIKKSLEFRLGRITAQEYFGGLEVLGKRIVSSEDVRSSHRDELHSVTRPAQPDEKVGLPWSQASSTPFRSNPFTQEYPSLGKYIALVKQQSGIDQKGLHDELEGIANELTEKWVKTEEEREVLELGRQFELLKKMFSLELTREELKAVTGSALLVSDKDVPGFPLRVSGNNELIYDGQRSRQRIEDFMSELGRLALKYAIELPTHTSSQSYIRNIARVFEDGERFYELALKRDQMMLSKALQALEAVPGSALPVSGNNELIYDGQRIGVLITGGFHSEGVTELLKQHDISHLVITPKVSKVVDIGKYQNLMLDAHISFQTLAFVSLFNRKIADRLAADVRLEFMKDFVRDLLDLSEKGKLDPNILEKWILQNEVRPDLNDDERKLLGETREKVERIGREGGIKRAGDFGQDEIKNLIQNGSQTMAELTIEILREMKHPFLDEALEMLEARATEFKAIEMVGSEVLGAFEKLNGGQVSYVMRFSGDRDKNYSALDEALAGKADDEYIMVVVDTQDDEKENVHHHVVAIDQVKNLNETKSGLVSGELRLEALEFILSYTTYKFEGREPHEFHIHVHNISLGKGQESVLRGKKLMSKVVERWKQFLEKTYGHASVSANARNPRSQYLLETRFHGEPMPKLDRDEIVGLTGMHSNDIGGKNPMIGELRERERAPGKGELTYSKTEPLLQERSTLVFSEDAYAVDERLRTYARAMGKLFVDSGGKEHVRSGITAVETDSVVTFTTTEGKPLYSKDGKLAQARVKEGTASFTFDRSILDSSAVSDGLRDYFERFILSQEIRILEQSSPVKGYSDGKTLYLREDLIHDAIALFHELGEGYYALYPEELPLGINAHTRLRGVGKDVREIASLGESLLAMTENRIDDLIEILRKELTEQFGPERINESEFALIRYNAAQGRRGKELLYGLQDVVFGEAANLALSERLRAQEQLANQRLDPIGAKKAKREATAFYWDSGVNVITQIRWGVESFARRWISRTSPLVVTLALLDVGGYVTLIPASLVSLVGVLIMISHKSFSKDYGILRLTETISEYDYEIRHQDGYIEKIKAGQKILDIHLNDKEIATSLKGYPTKDHAQIFNELLAESIPAFRLALEEKLGSREYAAIRMNTYLNPARLGRIKDFEVGHHRLKSKNQARAPGWLEKFLIWERQQSDFEWGLGQFIYHLKRGKLRAFPVKTYLISQRDFTMQPDLLDEIIQSLSNVAQEREIRESGPVAGSITPSEITEQSAPQGEIGRIQTGVAAMNKIKEMIGSEILDAFTVLNEGRPMSAVEISGDPTFNHGSLLHMLKNKPDNEFVVVLVATHHGTDFTVAIDTVENLRKNSTKLANSEPDIGALQLVLGYSVRKVHSSQTLIHIHCISLAKKLQDKKLMSQIVDQWKTFIEKNYGNVFLSTIAQSEIARHLFETRFKGRSGTEEERQAVETTMGFNRHLEIRNFLVGEIIPKEGRSPPHEVVNDYIRTVLPRDLLDDPRNISRYEEIIGGKRVRVIPIHGLFRSTGQLGHIGLGQVYHEPVIYVEAGLEGEERQRILSHELFEISLWEEKGESLRINPNQMRRWIQDNLVEAKRLAYEWHQVAPQIEDIWVRWRAMEEVHLVSLDQLYPPDINLAAGPLHKEGAVAKSDSQLAMFERFEQRIAVHTKVQGFLESIPEHLRIEQVMTRVASFLETEFFPNVGRSGDLASRSDMIKWTAEVLDPWIRSRAQIEPVTLLDPLAQIIDGVIQNAVGKDTHFFELLKGRLGVETEAKVLEILVAFVRQRVTGGSWSEKFRDLLDEDNLMVGEIESFLEEHGLQWLVRKSKSEEPRALTNQKGKQIAILKACLEIAA